jgi:abortive infection bacteriophage resistance protein
MATSDINIYQPRRYDKPPKSKVDLLTLLKDRGLEIESEARALHYLEYIGYYRLIGYLRWFQIDQKDRNQHLYQTGTTFEQILSHYVFDRELRVLIFDAIERIEVAFKATISNTMSEKYGDPHWFLRRHLFENAFKKSDGRKVQSHDAIMQDICRQLDRSKKQLFISHYYENYDEPFLPHSWAVFEILDFGALSKIYQSLNLKDRDLIAQEFGYKRASIESWMRSLSTLRNFCAHHARIWNNSLPNQPALPQEFYILHPGFHDQKSANYIAKRFFCFAIIIWALLRVVAPDSEWPANLMKLFQKYPIVSKAKLGFPDEWEDHPFWGIADKPSAINE